LPEKILVHLLRLLSLLLLLLLLMPQGVAYDHPDSYLLGKDEGKNPFLMGAPIHKVGFSFHLQQ
jgi:hypothetical protein